MRANAIAVLDATPPPSVRLYRATQGEQQEINDPGAGEHSNSTAPHRLIFSALATRHSPEFRQVGPLPRKHKHFAHCRTGTSTQ
jgi:hypothetical protein